MQIVDDQDLATGRTVSVVPSLAVELSWILLAASIDQLRVEQSELADAYASNATLADRVRKFWGDGVPVFGELLVLADHAGALREMDPTTLVKAVVAAASSCPSDLPLASESPSDRAVFLGRVRMLAESSRRRGRYEQLLGDAWSAADGRYRAEGRRRVELAADRFRREVDRGTDWVEVVSAVSAHLKRILPELSGRLPEGAPVTIAPSYFSGQGLLFDLPGGILVGVRARERGAGPRERTEALARRLKAVADPTRLAILDYLGQKTRTVGEIAEAFSLSQPTVSNHVKVLRAAGVVSGRRRGARLELTVSPESAIDLVDELGRLLRPGAVVDGEVRP